MGRPVHRRAEPALTAGGGRRRWTLRTDFATGCSAVRFPGWFQFGLRFGLSKLRDESLSWKRHLSEAGDFPSDALLDDYILNAWSDGSHAAQ